MHRPPARRHDARHASGHFWLGVGFGRSAKLAVKLVPDLRYPNIKQRLRNLYCYETELSIDSVAPNQVRHVHSWHTYWRRSSSAARQPGRSQSRVSVGWSRCGLRTVCRWPWRPSLHGGLVGNRGRLVQRHLWYVLTEYVEHCKRARQHRSLGLRGPLASEEPGQPMGEVVCRSRLGGLLIDYSRRAA